MEQTELKEILKRRGALHILNGVRFYTESSVLAAMKEVVEKLNRSVPTKELKDITDEEIENLDKEHRLRVYTKPTVGGNFTFGVYSWKGGAEGWEQITGIVEKSYNTNREAKIAAIESAKIFINSKLK